MSGASGLRKHGHTSAGDGGTISLPSDAVDVTYDNSGSGLAATDVQGAIDELDTTVDGLGGAGVEIDDDAALIQGVNFEDQGSNPASPAASHHVVFAKAGGIYAKDSAATVVGPFGSVPQALDTSDSPQFTAVNLGHASDTTLARVSAGVVSIEGTNIVKAGAVTSSGLTQATGKLLGRSSASTGAIEEITIGTNLSLSGGTLDASGGGGGAVATDVIWDAAGDLAVGTGANTAARLAPGTSTQALMGGSSPSWGPGAATSWTPALTAASSNPTLGSGSAVEGHYIQIGKLVFAWGSVSFGSSGTNAGSGEYYISLPVTAVSTSPRAMGTIAIFDNSATRFFDAIAYYSSTTVFRMAIGETAGSPTASDAAPMVPAASDAYIFSLMYEAA